MAGSKFLSFVAIPGVCNKSNEFVDLFNPPDKGTENG
jgi:hypothetical protein